MNGRTDALGRAYAGSQLQIQTYVNRRQPELNDAIRNAIAELEEAEITWVCPLEDEQFAEYRDELFLGAVGHPGLASRLASFWPSGGPQWDGLARVQFPHRAGGVLLVEAKSYPAEMYSDGCRAGEESRRLIEDSISKARVWFGAAASAEWMGTLYQFANRLAHLYFLREVAGIPAWFANICFIGDPHSPTPRLAWEDAMRVARCKLGFRDVPLPHVADVYLEAAGRELFQTPPRRRVLTVVGDNVPRANREWRFLRNDRGGHQFLAFAKARGSSSMRCFDAESGILLGPPRYGKNADFQDAFRFQIAASEAVDGPGAVNLEQIPAEQLESMRRQAGLGPRSSAAFAPAPRTLLSGVDGFIDECLSVEHIAVSLLDSHHVSHTRTGRRV